MAERQTEITPVKGTSSPARKETSGWGTSPWGPFQRFADEMDRVFDDFGLGRRFPSLRRHLGGEMWAPDVDVYQKNDQLTIKADLPGLTKDDISVEITDNAVTIHGERRHGREEEREGVFRSERSYGSFYRVIPLPEGTITDQAKATFRDGVLEISMPTPPTSKGRRLEISESTKK